VILYKTELRTDSQDGCWYMSMKVHVIQHYCTDLSGDKRGEDSHTNTELSQHAVAAICVQ
jgi:hypothetical protein